MQVVTCMQSTAPRSSSPAETRKRLLEAAARVFARHGLTGATTRAIAEEAGVNEVTLFRHFHSKDGLLAAVVGQNFGADAHPTIDAPPPETANLRADLLAHAHRYSKLLEQNLPLVRTMIGEIHHRHRDQERQVFMGIFGPVKADLFKRIESAHTKGELRPEVRCDLVADLFGAMIFTGVLRRAAPSIIIDYDAETYLEGAVDLVLAGAATPGGPTHR